MPVRCAILDDYQNVALAMADWSKVKADAEIKVFTEPSVVAALQDRVLLRIDLTREDEDPALGALKTKYHVATLPAVRVATTSGETLAEVNEFVPPAEFLKRIAVVDPPRITP